MRKKDPYSQAVSSGMYRRQKGIRGKYDNVRIFWEDEITRIFLRPFVERRFKEQQKKGKKFRILDLGCGSGDGYEMFRDLNKSKPGLSKTKTKLLNNSSLELYKGIENNKDLLAQNSERWGNKSKMICSWGDFSQGLPVEKDERPYDVYFTSYGVMSHINEEETVRLFSDIARHADNSSVVIGDWLGRYSYEWQELWTDEITSEQWMDYYISYIYPSEIRKGLELTPLKLRLMSREEITKILDKVEENTGISWRVEEIFDRSLFAGRHMDTNDYNKYLHPLRNQINLLFERGRRTDLKKLKVNYHSHATMQSQNNFFAQFSFAWNTIIEYTAQLLKNKDGEKISSFSEGNEKYPGIVLSALEKIYCIVKDIGCFQMDDVRADVIEPQLGYCLRNLEMKFQKGRGNGHGLVGIFTIKK